MDWNRIKNWWGFNNSTEINKKDVADYLNDQLDEVEGETMNELTYGADLFIETEKLIKFFYRRHDSYFYSNEFFTVDARNIMVYFGENTYMLDAHNNRKREWTSKEHEMRVAYLIARQSYSRDYIEINVNEIESGIYDLLLVDGYHRLLAASLMMKPRIRVIAKDNYTIALANEILLDVQ